MKDLRMIRVDDDGVIEFVDTMDGFVEGREAAIQRLVLAMLMTPGTIVDAASYGGGIKRLYLARRKDKKRTRESVKSVVVDTKLSLLPHEPDNTPYKITDITLQSVERLSGRGYSVSIGVDFSGASGQSITIPSETYGTP